MDDMNHRKMNDSLFDGSLLDELNGRKPDKISESSEDTSDKKLSDKSDTEKANSVKPAEDERSNTKLFIVRVLAVAVGVLGVIMLVCGIALHRLDEESRRTPEKEQMPEEYIEEFFSDEHFTPNIEDYLEPEA